MNEEEIQEYCRKVIEDEYKQNILNFMIEIETLKLKNKDLQQQNEFLRQRENKLQMIEQMFKNGSVDLGDLARLVEEK